MLIGRSADGRLTFDPTGVTDGWSTILDFIPPGGPIAGYSAAVPGFSMVLQSRPADDLYALATGADVWVELIRIDVPLLLVETPSYVIVNSRIPPEMRVGSGSQAHSHPLWLLDTTDPAYDGSRCIWEATFVLRDRGTTHYQDSLPFTFRFTAGSPRCPADFDCDNDVDADDFEILRSCATRAALPYDPHSLPPGCPAPPDHHAIIRPDLDRDGDVDMSDFAIFQRCISGTGVPADVACAP